MYVNGLKGKTNSCYVFNGRSPHYVLCLRASCYIVCVLCSCAKVYSMQQVLSPEMSLATVRTYIWKKPEDLILNYRVVQYR
jgi:hypothetical protein